VVAQTPPGALRSLRAGADCAAKTVRSWEAAPFWQGMGQSSSSAGEGRGGSQGRAQELSGGLLLCVKREKKKSSSLSCSRARLFRMVSYLFKAVALSLQALQTCKKSHRYVSKYDHRYPKGVQA